MKTILVPIDFSQNSQSAVDAAKLIARKTGAKIYLMHAYTPFMPTEIHVGVNLEIYSDLENSLKADLKSVEDQLVGEGLNVESIWVEGAVLKNVKEQANALNADLVVIGRTGRGGFLDKLFGSVALDIVKNCEMIPVLTIPPDAELTKVEQIVYATRLEEDEHESIRVIVAIARALSAQLKFLKLNSLIQPDIQPDHQFIDPIKAEFGFKDEDFIIADTGRHSLVSQIEEQAVKLNADILVVSAREKGFVEELLVDPSISKKILLNTKIPLLSCRLMG